MPRSPFFTLDEIREALRFVEVWERARHMSQAEADEWQRRIVARQAFLRLTADHTPAA